MIRLVFQVSRHDSEIRNVSPAAYCLLVSHNSPFAIRNVLLAAFRLLPSAFWSFAIRHSKFVIAPASVPHYCHLPTALPLER